jgi:hypothetical protein
MNETVFESLVEVMIDPEDFLKIKETLSRVGILSRREKKLFQSCHIFHRRGRYFIVSFKEMFALDDRETNFTEDDIARRNRIVRLLAEWGLVKIPEQSLKKISSPLADMSQIKVISFSEKRDYILESKYTIGRVKR